MLLSASKCHFKQPKHSLIILSKQIYCAKLPAKKEIEEDIINSSDSIKSANIIQANPIIIVDDVETDIPIASLNPDNIESVTIFKGEEAIAKFGIRALNGAIVIVSKINKTKSPN